MAPSTGIRCWCAQKLTALSIGLLMCWSLCGMRFAYRNVGPNLCLNSLWDKNNGHVPTQFCTGFCAKYKVWELSSLGIVPAQPLTSSWTLRSSSSFSKRSFPWATDHINLRLAGLLTLSTQCLTMCLYTQDFFPSPNNPFPGYKTEAHGS